MGETFCAISGVVNDLHAGSIVGLFPFKLILSKINKIQVGCRWFLESPDI